MSTKNFYNKEKLFFLQIIELLLEIFDYLNATLTKFGAIINSPKICALSWKIAIKRHNFKTKKNKKNILILYKSLSIEDFSYFKSKDKKKFSMFVFPRRQIKAIFEIFFGNRKNHSLRDVNYISKNSKIEQSKLSYRKFLIKTLKLLNLDYKFSTIIGFNFRFYAERELHHAATESKIKFICLHKESLIFPGEVNSYKKILNKYGKYGGDYILVYNDYFKKVITSTKIVNARKVKNIGMPRADYYYNLKDNKNKKINKKYFLVFMINTKRSIFYIKNNDYIKKTFKLNLKDIIWDKLSKSMIKNILEFARKNQNVEFIFKIKKPPTNEKDLKNLGLESLLYDSKLSNWKIIHDVNTGRLIKDAKAIIGFNTTSLVESLIVNKLVIVPRFGINKKNVLKNFTLNLGNCVNYAKNEDQFQSLMKKAVTGELNKFNCNKKIVKKIINFYIGNSDGLSTKRLLNYI